MPQVDVKISELAQNTNGLSNFHLFLGNTIKYLENSETINSLSPYHSYAVDLSTLNSTIIDRPREVTREWIFNKEELPPEQMTRFDPRKFCSEYILSSSVKRKGIISDDNLYVGNEDFFPETPETPIDDLSVSQYAIANLDYVDKMAALLYDTWIGSLKEFLSVVQKDAVIPSKIGDIVYSTTLSSLDLVKKYYGNGRLLFKIGNVEYHAPNTNWKQLTKEYFLVAADSNVVANSDDKTGGNNSLRQITERYLKKHHHGITDHDHTIKIKGSSSTNTPYLKKISNHNGSSKQESGKGEKPIDSITNVPYTGSVKFTTSENVSLKTDGSAKDSAYSGEEYEKDIQQAYKNVYVWERIPL